MSDLNEQPIAKRRWVPRHRRMAVDISIASKSVPSFPLVRTMQLERVDAGRRASKNRIGWTAMFLHAYSRVCHEVPELRDIYVSWPTPYLYRHPEVVASVTIHRRDGEGNERLIWGRIQSPHQLAIDAVQSSVDRFTHDSIDEVFADGLRMERRPAILRRATWWLLTRCCGRKRAKHVGTFSISSLGQLGALNGYHPLVTTSSLAIGPLERDGKCDVALICDHRVIDGVLAARALQRLERLLLESADGLQIPQPFSTAA
jgi:hypothetical protein